ncbi:hypothetical protein [Rhodohalobacter sulfatireducens]|uniref:Uncharacterized protein n=1 Tax=Rhodohalobacter sulfatireducens TaxID=2911366 RepID=A0ABS9KG46_9BACT|nr:hypothetical protein [Rhodohalobacter sulfatireducens]MCG2589813.1 hypothetical protein [Rhodohalobacter sulfatireducens]
MSDAVPSTYEIDGKQYVIIAATGGTRAGNSESDAFYFFFTGGVKGRY